MEIASETTGLDIATAIAAGYAALIATVAVVVNFVTWFHTWQTRLKVELRRMESITPGATGSREPLVLFRLINHSGHLVKVTHVALAPIRKGGEHLLIPHPLGLPQPGPFEIAPRDARMVWIKPDVLAGGDPDHKTRALIATSDGKEFESKRVRVRELIADQDDES